MRTIRALKIATAIVVALPTLASAQRGRQFNNSWFWGAKAGGAMFGNSSGNYRAAPIAGIDWMITRTHGGLYISGSQAFFNEKTYTFRDPNFPIDSGYREIHLKNMRRLDFAAVGFPGNWRDVHPYFGAGFAAAVVADADPVGPFYNVAQYNFAQQVVHDEKAQIAPFGIIGSQWRLKWGSVFGQITGTTTHRDFILYNGRSANLTYEIGARYNIGSSIDRK